MPYHSVFYDVDVRDEIAREFSDSEGIVDDMMAGLHEIRARIMARRWPATTPTEGPGPSNRAAPARSR
jgi:hypothetical protein